jgi:hypothetical protein
MERQTTQANWLRYSAVIIVGQFHSSFYRKEFEGYAFDLDTALDETFKKGTRAQHRGRKWEPFTSMQKQAKMDALGRVRQDMKLEDLSELVIDKSRLHWIELVILLTKSRYFLL